MKSGFVLLIMLPVFLCSAIREVRAGDPVAAPLSINVEEVRAARDRLSTSLFSRGELADLIIDAGLQGRLVRLTGQETRSEVRLALLGWIKSDLDQAANIHLYLKDRRPGDPIPPEVIIYKVRSSEINPRFLELIQDVDRVAKDAGVSKEEMSLVAQRLFDGPQTQPEAYAPWVPDAGRGTRGAGSGAAARGAGNAGEAGYADYRLDTASVEREKLALGGWFEKVKAALEAELSGAGKENGLSSRRGLFDETFSIYKNFVVAASGLKGRTKITREESAGLEALRFSLRKNLGRLETLSVMRKINQRAAAIPAGSPGAGALRADARRIEEALKAFLDDLGKDPESAGSAAARLYELKKAFDFWTIRFSAHGRLADLKGRITDRGFSCVFDKLVFKYLSRFRPSADYVRLEAVLASRAKAIAVSLEGVAAGDYETAALFSGGKKGSLAGKILEAEAEAARLESYSRFNRRLQFFFWDTFANPFGLGPGPKGIRAENKLLF